MVSFLKDEPEDVYTGTFPIVRCLLPEMTSDRHKGNARGIKGSLISLLKEVSLRDMCLR